MIRSIIGGDVLLSVVELVRARKIIMVESADLCSLGAWRGLATQTSGSNAVHR